MKFNIIKSIKFSFLLVTIFTFFIACDLFGINTATKIVITPENTNLKENKPVTLYAKGFNSKNKELASLEINWKASQGVKIISADSTKAIIELQKPMRAIIEAFSKDYPSISAKAIITYKGEIERLSFAESNYSMDIQEIKRIQILYQPEGVLEKDVIVSVEDPNIATASYENSQLVVKGKNTGSTKIEIKSLKNNNIKASLNINISGNIIPLTEPSYIKLSDNLIQIEKNYISSSSFISATVYDRYERALSNSVVEFSISNDVASLSPIGFNQILITPLKAGYSKVIAKVKGTNITSTLFLKYGKLIDSIYFTTNSINIVKGQSINTKININPVSAQVKDEDFIWSSKGNLLSFNSVGVENNLLALNLGREEISVSHKDDKNLKATLVVNILDKNLADPNISHIQVNKSIIFISSVNEEIDLSAEVYNRNNLLSSSEVNFTSSNPQDIIVNNIYPNKAKIRVNKLRRATITATAKNNPKVKSIISIIPSVAAENITTNVNKIKIPLNSTKSIEYTLFPSSSTSNSLIFNFSNNNVSQVSKNDSYVTIRADHLGSTTMNITDSINSSLRASVEIEVVAANSVDLSYISLSSNNNTLDIAEAFNLSIEAIKADGSIDSNASIKIKASDSSIISVNEITANKTYRIQGLKTGFATISVQSTLDPSLKSNSYICVGKPLQTISLENNTIVLKRTQKRLIPIHFYPLDATNKELKLSSTNSNIVLSSINNGKLELTGALAGSTTISVSSVDNPLIKQDIIVSVDDSIYVDHEIVKLTITPNTINIDPPFTKNQKFLSASIERRSGVNDNVGPGEVEYTIDNAQILKGEYVNNLYYISALKPGDTFITVKAIQNPSITSKVLVKVKGGIQRIIPSSDVISIGTGFAKEFKVQLEPQNLIDKNLIWLIDNPSDQKIRIEKTADPSKVIISALKPGETIVTVKSLNNQNINTFFKVKTILTPVNVPIPTKLSLSENIITLTPPFLAPKLISATVSDQNNQNYLGAQVKWNITLSDERLAALALTGESYDYRKDFDIDTYDNRILFTPKNAGQYVLEAQLVSNPTVKTKSIMIVNGAITGLTPSVATLIMREGDSNNLSVNIQPSNALDKKIKWESKTPSIFTVLGNGANAVVSAIKEGQGVLEISSINNPSIRTSIIITVKKKLPLAINIQMNPTVVELQPNSPLKKVIKASVSGAPVNNAGVTFSIYKTNKEGKVLSECSSCLSHSINSTSNQIIISALASGYYKVRAKANAQLNSYADTTVIVGGELKSLKPGKGVSAIVIDVGESSILSVEYVPEITDQRNIKWTSDQDGNANPVINLTYVTPGTSAILTANRAGDATITATSLDNPKIEVKFKVKVRSLISQFIMRVQNSNPIVQGDKFKLKPNESITLETKMNPKRKLNFLNKGAIFGTLEQVKDAENTITFKSNGKSVGSAEILVTYRNFKKIITLDIGYDNIKFSNNDDIKLYEKEIAQLGIVDDKGLPITLPITWDIGKMNDAGIFEVDNNQNHIRMSTSGANKIIKGDKNGHVLLRAKVEISPGNIITLFKDVYVSFKVSKELKQIMRSLSIITENEANSEYTYLTDDHLKKVVNFTYNKRSPIINARELNIFKELQTLDISGSSINSFSLDLRRFKKLKNINISDIINSNNNDKITSIKIPDSARFLKAENNKINGRFDLSNLEEAYLDNNEISNISLNSDIKYLSINNNKLRRLNINNNSSSLLSLKASYNLIESFHVDNNNIKTIDISYNDLRYDDFKFKKNQISADSLTNLNLSNNKIGLRRDKEIPIGYPREHNAEYENREDRDPYVPAQSIILDFLPSLESINLENCYIRTGLIEGPALGQTDFIWESKYGGLQRADFIICSPKLNKVNLNGNFIGPSTFISKTDYDGAYEKNNRYQKFYNVRFDDRKNIEVIINNIWESWHNFSDWYLENEHLLVRQNINSTYNDIGQAKVNKHKSYSRLWPNNHYRVFDDGGIRYVKRHYER